MMCSGDERWTETLHLILSAFTSRTTTTIIIFGTIMLLKSGPHQPPPTVIHIQCGWPPISCFPKMWCPCWHPLAILFFVYQVCILSTCRTWLAHHSRFLFYVPYIDNFVSSKSYNFIVPASPLVLVPCWAKYLPQDIPFKYVQSFFICSSVLHSEQRQNWAY